MRDPLEIAARLSHVADLLDIWCPGRGPVCREAAACIREMHEAVKTLHRTEDGVPITIGMRVYFRAVILVGVPINSFVVGSLTMDGPRDKSGGIPYFLRGDKPEPMWSTEMEARLYHARVRKQEADEAALAARALEPAR